jgi:hypothetical protein
LSKFARGALRSSVTMAALSDDMRIDGRAIVRSALRSAAISALVVPI